MPKKLKTDQAFEISEKAREFVSRLDHYSVRDKTKQELYFWMLANANVRAKNIRKNKKWSEEKIMKRTKARYYTRLIWRKASMIVPKPFGGAFMNTGQMLEAFADDVQKKLNEGVL